mmetsp:Transcript_45377/g.105994  ORF Transcript_45377/g.105994 Transcript_45377/m.105994 type:complete len:271 (+) Transcript_45377:559-1371(+)
MATNGQKICSGRRPQLPKACSVGACFSTNHTESRGILHHLQRAARQAAVSFQHPGSADLRRDALQTLLDFVFLHLLQHGGRQQSLVACLFETVQAAELPRPRVRDTTLEPFAQMLQPAGIHCPDQRGGPVQPLVEQVDLAARHGLFAPVSSFDFWRCNGTTRKKQSQVFHHLMNLVFGEIVANSKPGNDAKSYTEPLLKVVWVHGVGPPHWMHQLEQKRLQLIHPASGRAGMDVDCRHCDGLLVVDNATKRGQDGKPLELRDPNSMVFAR